MPSLYYSNLLLFCIARLYLYLYLIIYILFLIVLLSYVYLTLLIACIHDRQFYLITVFKIEIYYTPIKSFWTNIPRHVADKGHSGMPCVHMVSRCLPHVRLKLFDSLCNLNSLYIIIVMLLSYFFFFVL